MDATVDRASANLSDRRADVLIVGAGPTGIVAALCLAQCGVSSILLERKPDLETHPKAHEISARTLEIFTRLGVDIPSLYEEASPHDEGSRVLFCDTLDKELGCIDLGEAEIAAKYARHVASPRPYLNLSQVELERRLRRHLAGQHPVTFLANHQWEEARDDGDGVVSTVTHRGEGRAFTVRSRYLIGADGAGSRVRKGLGIEMDGPEKVRDFVSCYFDADLSGVVNTAGKLYFLFNPGANSGALIAHDVRKRWVLHTTVHTPHERVEDVDEAELRRRIRVGIGGADVPIHIRSISPWRMTAQVAQTFSRGRVFLAGDAAHRFPPTGGLGLNSGVGDAHNLAWKLARVIRGQASPDLLATYETERRPVVERNCQESLENFDRMGEIAEAFGVSVEEIDAMNERLSSSPVTALPKPGQAWLRRQVERYGASVLGRFDTDPRVRERVTAAIARQVGHFDRIGLDLGYQYESAAVLGDGTEAEPTDAMTYVPTTRPGARLPHFWLDGNLKTRSSHSLLSYARLTLIVGPAVAVSDDALRVAKEAGVELVRADRPEVPLACVGLTLHHLQIGWDGALLVRPDDHIAWRERRGVSVSGDLIRSLLAQVGLRA